MISDTIRLALIMFWTINSFCCCCCCCHYFQSSAQCSAFCVDIMAESDYQEFDKKETTPIKRTSFISFSDDFIIVYIGERLQHAYFLKSINKCGNHIFLPRIRCFFFSRCSYYLMRMILISWRLFLLPRFVHPSSPHFEINSDATVLITLALLKLFFFGELAFCINVVVAAAFFGGIGRKEACSHLHFGFMYLLKLAKEFFNLIARLIADKSLCLSLFRLFFLIVAVLLRFHSHS